MNTKATYVSVARALEGLTDEELRAITDNPAELKKFAGELVTKIAENIFVADIRDEDVPEKYRDVVAAWRKYAAAMGYTGPVAWRVKAGFTLKQHAPLAGPCHDKLAYLQSWELENDEPTKDSIVFWVPRLAEDSLGKCVADMNKLRNKLRKQHKLPDGHCDRFGSIALLFALILAHFKRTGERVPLKSLYAASDTLGTDGCRLCAGSFVGTGLYCADWWSDGGDDDVGFFLLGVEELGQ